MSIDITKEVLKGIFQYSTLLQRLEAFKKKKEAEAKAKADAEAKAKAVAVPKPLLAPKAASAGAQPA